MMITNIAVIDRYQFLNVLFVKINMHYSKTLPKQGGKFDINLSVRLQIKSDANRCVTDYLTGFM